MRQLLPLAIPLALLACKPNEPSLDAGLAVHQSEVVAGEGTAAERRVEVLEDARITPGLRYWLWGGSKDPGDFLKEEGLDLDDAARASLAKTPLLRGLVRLVDRDGKVLEQRRLDCELGEVVTPALAQGESGSAYAFGDDCSTGDGDYAGLITRFFTVEGDKFRWQSFADAGTGEHLEVTLVQARKITWHLVPKTRADEVFEVSTHSDFNDLRFKSLAAGAAPPPDLPQVTDYLHYRYDGHGGWTRQVRTVPGAWNPVRGFPAPEEFP